LNKNFIRVPRPHNERGKGAYWAMAPDAGTKKSRKSPTKHKDEQAHSRFPYERSLSDKAWHDGDPHGSRSMFHPGRTHAMLHDTPLVPQHSYSTLLDSNFSSSSHSFADEPYQLGDQQDRDQYLHAENG
jgi:hypothetical protein